ncbi:adenosylcobinamide-GDP ribazoletransferase [Brassicibacter mesophilus]|uniref:adenosylcobinamide-GDP ribazoletransferase n=1 Tax=Brassicibacter mesophilus TaxID=745119 RepID=UPI003D1DCC56
MKNLLLMMTFFTRLPVRYNYEYDEKDLIKGIKLFPIIGLIIGVLIYAPTLLSSYVHKPILVIAVWIIYIWLTGGLHIDGLADTFDGVFSNRDRDRMLEIMKDSRIGTFGVLGIIILIISNIGLSYYIDYKVFILVPIIGRSSALLSASISEYARKEGGMGTAFIENCGVKEAGIAITFSFIMASAILAVNALLSILITYIIVIMLTNYIKGKLGGMTGDTMGFIIELSQTFFILFVYLLRGMII